MIGKVMKGRGFSGLARYLELGRDANNPDRVAESTNTGPDNRRADHAGDGSSVGSDREARLPHLAFLRSRGRGRSLPRVQSTIPFVLASKP